MSDKTYFVRTCQECGHKQAMPEPGKHDAWRDSPCRKCRSPALDFGSDGWVKDAGGHFVKQEEEEGE